MVPDIVEIKRLCASGQWNTRVEDGKILLHDTVAGETVCIGQTDAEPVRHGEWGLPEIVGYDGVHAIYGVPCSACCEYTELYKPNYCPNCGAKMDGCG